MSTNSSNGNFDLSDSIAKLKEIEEYLFQKLEAVNMTDTKNTAEQDDIISKISDLSKLRDNIFTQLGTLYVTLNNNAQIERSSLVDQGAIQKMLDSQLQNLQSQVDSLEDVRTSKQRMVEIGQYEYLRYSAHKQVMKTIAFSSLALLAVSVLMKNAIVPKKIGQLLILATVSVGAVLVIQQVWSMTRKSNQNYNRFRQPSVAAMQALAKDTAGASGYPDTVWEHDKNWFRWLWGEAKAEEHKTYNELKTEAQKAEAAAKQAEAGALNKMNSVKCIAAGNTWKPATATTPGTCVPAKSKTESFQSRVRAAPELTSTLHGAPFN